MTNFYDNSRETRRVFDDTVVLGGDRTPCIICGHPGGDCPGSPESAPKVIFGLGISETFDNAQMILVEEDIYEERQINPYVKANVVIHRKGKYIPFKEAERLGLVTRPKLS
jgi:hypothetical protein